MEKNPYDIIKFRHVTEKASVLGNLQASQSNASVRKCQTPKVVFVVDINANKQEIAWAFEKIYERKKVKVLAVNTLRTKPKPRRLRGRPGFTVRTKKAIITLQPGNSIDAQA